MQSVPFTNNVVSSNPAHGEVYSIQHYVIKYVSDLRQVGGFLSSTNKNDRYDITEILLKVAINTITLIPTLFLFIFHKFDLSLGIEPHWWYNVYCG